MRASRPGGSGSGGGSHGFVVVRRTLMVLFAAVAARLAFLQVFGAGEYAARAESQRTNRITLHSRRGTIYDRNGNVLAMSEECSTVYANPEEVSDPSGVAAALVSHLGGEKQDYMKLLTQDTTFVYLQRQVDQETADALKAELSEKDLAGVYYLADTKRVYPYGNVGAQVLGYVGVDGKGLSGIEQQYDDILTGTDGEMLVETGLYGTPIAGGASQVTEAEDGTDLVLAIDIDLQQACEEIIAKGVSDYSAESGSVMVCDPRTGEVLAACSTPLPDFSDLTDSSSLNLKLVSSSFEPGSVFKVITTAIGIDDGLFSTDTVYSVPPAYTVGSDTVRDDDLRDYEMEMDVREMMRRSSNTAMALLAEEVIGAKAFSEGVDRWGIGHKTGIDFPGEAEGIVKTLEEYDGSTLGSMAFGQGVAVPLVQIVRAYGAVANGGVPCTPHFLVERGGEEVEWPEGEAVCSAETAAAETDLLLTVVREGTAENAQIEGYDIAAKTGTGEQAGESGGYEEGKFVASLCGFVNAADPEALVYVGLNGLPYLAAETSAHVFRDVMEQTVQIMGIVPVS